MKYYLAPSILAADFNHLGSQIETVEAAGAQWLHIDVMDGMFVPNFSVGVPVVESIRKTSGLFFDVHLMMESPIRYIRQFAEAGADSITFHIEAVNDPIRVIEEIRAMDRRVGVSVKPRPRHDGRAGLRRPGIQAGDVREDYEIKRDARRAGT